jgi:starch phosphorylase
MPGTQFQVEIRPRIPEPLKRLEELANDLYYSWNRGVRRLFCHLDDTTWDICLSNPKVFLRRVSQQRLEEAARDPIFLADFRSVLSAYDTYMQERPFTGTSANFDAGRELIAYFSAEFGFHQSVPIYAGGLGILAGDYCKAMSNLWVPFVGVGLLYREGYFTQRVLADGRQLAHYPHVDPEDLPVVAAVDPTGREVYVEVDIQGNSLRLKVWRAQAGHIRLYLLDSGLPENTPEQRQITNKLYGGNLDDRIRQEIVLGIGGVRALRAMGLAPTVWHINEGHAAFQILERCREHKAQGLDFASALELAAANTVFTTHTPVPAGHDIFPNSQMRGHFEPFIKELEIEERRFFDLGASPRQPDGFNMTSLSLRGSRFHNGVSRIHGEVASQMECYIWPQIQPEENPMGYVTNGTDVDTFLGMSWVALFDMYMGRGWRAKLTDKAFWEGFVSSIPDHVYQSVRQVHKMEMFQELRRRAVVQLQRNGFPESLVREITRNLSPENLGVLVIGFARRFATYKRATLLFKDLGRLARLVDDPRRPVLFVFAGKAHPNDEPGQALIREVTEISMRPEFRGKILFLEDYNISLARSLYPGVDVWLNVPEYPKEACGTSGMKAGINGAINLSVLDGWWGEAYDGDNGWAITPHPELDPRTRDDREANELLTLLEQQVVPLYFARNDSGDPEAWIAKSKASMRTILPHYNGIRMANDYLRNYYGPAARHGRLLGRDQAAGARALAAWRRKIQESWPSLRIRLASPPPRTVNVGEPVPISVAVYLNGLDAEDVEVECLLGKQNDLGELIPAQTLSFNVAGTTDHGETLYHVDLCEPRPTYSAEGLEAYKIRVYPHHPMLEHRFETGYMRWL